MAFGNYLTSFLRIFINTDKDLGNLKSKTLTDYEQGVFVHEYTHFLQNITSSFGQLHVWNTYDRLRQYIADIQKSKKTELKLPLGGSIAEEQHNLWRIRKMMEGNGRVAHGIDDTSTRIVKHSFVKDEVYAAMHPGKGDLYHLKLDLVDKYNDETQYIFGEIAVSEMMAYLMELKYYKGPVPPVYPYMACLKLGEYMGTALLTNDEFLFALCDVSLLSGYPGVMFYRILNDIIQQGIQLKSAEDMFDHGINYMYAQGWQVYEDYEKNMNGAIHVIAQLLPHTNMEPTIEWVAYLLRVGLKVRKETPYLMINLYREPELFDGYWNAIMLQFGNPSLHNNVNQRWFKAPYDIVAIENQIEPLYLLAIQEIRSTLIEGNYSCGLYSYCDTRKDGTIVDDRCKYEPWERANDEQKCAYGALWFLYGLSEKNVVF